MDVAAIAGLCAVLAHGGSIGSPPSGAPCPPPQVVSASTGVIGAKGAVFDLVGTPRARDGIARVAYAEAGDQGDSGLAAVVYTILNRVADGRWGRSVDAVLDAHAQFEPVLRAGGDWRRLPSVSAAQQARIDTILNLALDGRLPDLTHGARYFQNPAIVARRAQSGEVSARLVNFGGAVPSAVVGAHSFFVTVPTGGEVSERRQRVLTATPPVDAIFVRQNRADGARSDLEALPVEPASSPVAAPAQVHANLQSNGIFVLPDGTASNALER